MRRANPSATRRTIPRAGTPPYAGRRCTPRCRPVAAPMHDVLTIALFVLTIAGVIARPRGWSEAAFCVAGAVAMLLFGVVTAGAAWRAVADQWDVLLFLAGLVLVSWAAER